MNRNILNPSEKENLNILLGFILTKLSEDEKKSKEDHNFSKLRNYEIIYVPQKQQSFEKENEELEKILTKYKLFFFFKVFGFLASMMWRS